MKVSKAEMDRKFVEYIILLLIGFADKEISCLHIQKEIFLLCEFDEDLKEFYDFIKHYRGPFSSIVDDSISNPFYLSGCWDIIPPKSYDKLSGGYLKITDEGKEKLSKFLDKVDETNNSKLIHIINGAEILSRMYNSLSLEELLLLIYAEFPDFTEKSNVYDKIKNKKEILSKKLLEGDFIDKGKYQELLQLQ